MLDYERMQRGRGLRRLSRPLPALAVRDGVRASHEEPHLRALEDLRDGHQQRPLPTRTCSRATRWWTRSWSWPTSRARRLLQEQLLASPSTNRKMIDEMANHATRVRRHMERLGVDKVESFIDACLSLENLIDPMSPFIVRKQRRASRRRRRTQRETHPKMSALAGQGLHGRVHQPARVHRGSRRSSWSGDSDKPRRFPASPSATCCCSCCEHAPLDALAARHARDHPRRGLLLRAAGPDEDHERGLGHVLALASIMTERALNDVRDHRLRRPPLRAPWPRRRAAQPLQARHRAVPRHRGALEQGPVRAASGTSATTIEQRRTLGQAPGPGPGEDLRGPRASTTTSPSSTSFSPRSSARSRSSSPSR